MSNIVKNSLFFRTMRPIARFHSILTITLLLITAGAFLGGCQNVPLDQLLLSDQVADRSKALRKLIKLNESRKSRLVPPLIEGIKNDDSRISNRAMNALVLIGMPAVDPLIPLLKDADPYIRLNSAAALGQMTAHAQPAIPALTEAVTDSHPLVREEAAHALGAFGPLAISASGALTTAAQKDADKNVREAAADALRKMGIEFQEQSKKVG